MKNSIIFSVLCLLLTVFSFNVNAQQCNAQYDVDVAIQSVVWDAGPCDWARITGASISIFGTVPSYPNDYPESFHAVVLDIDYNMPHWGSAAHYRFDVDFTQYGGSEKRVYVFYNEKPGVSSGGIEPIIDTEGVLTGFEITPPDFGTNGGGVVTNVVMGRGGRVAFSNNIMTLKVSNRVGTSTGGISCQDSNFYDGDWNDLTGSGDDCSSAHFRVAQDSEENIPNVNIYPNPVQDNLFVETGELDISNISIVTLDGQVLNQKVSIRRGIDRTQINTTQLSPGIYLLRIETSTDNIIKKVVVH